MARRPAPPGAQHSGGLAHFAELARATVPPMHPAGVPFVAGPLAVAAIGHRSKWLRRGALLAAGSCGAFFRNPRRVPPNRPGVVVAPADGEVSLVDAAVPPPELGMGEQPLPRVSVFLSIFDVHTQRSPVAGEVISVVHRDGRFLSADLPEASDANERNSMLLRTAAGHYLAVVQIAGLVARRIVCDAKPGDTLPLGDTYGLIRFGSRVDTYFPAGTRPLVLRGQRTVGGETVLAELP